MFVFCSLGMANSSGNPAKYFYAISHFYVITCNITYLLLVYLQIHYRKTHRQTAGRTKKPGQMTAKPIYPKKGFLTKKPFLFYYKLNKLFVGLNTALTGAPTTTQTAKTPPLTLYTAPILPEG